MSAALLSDLGGTHVRFALSHGGGPPEGVAVRRNEGYASFEEAARDYLAGRRIDRAALAVAGPVADGRVAMTNLDWTLDAERIAAALAIAEVRIFNDFEAQALALPELGAEHLAPVGEAALPRPRAPCVALGPGTGLGAAGLLPEPAGGWRAVAGEAGHMTLAAADEDEALLLGEIRRRLGHVSAERLLSGPGLALLHRALTGDWQSALSPAEIAARAADGDPAASAAIGHFSRFLATVASDLALVFAAGGGVYLSGGVLRRLGPLFDADAYRARFVDKGRFADYLAPIPTLLVRHETPALLGLAAALRSPAG